MAITLTQAFLANMLTGTNTTVTSGDYKGMLNGAKACLFTNQPVLTSLSVYGDLDAPTWTGYVELVVTWSGPVVDGLGNLLLNSQVLDFVPSAAPSPAVLVYGYGIYSPTVPTSGHNLVGAEYFPTPVSVSTTLTAVIFAVQMILPQAPVYGGAVML